MSVAQYRTPRGTLRAETEQIYAPTMGRPTKPDKTWRYTDKKGHKHYYVEDVTGAFTSDDDSHYLTLRRHIEKYYCHDCHDEHTDSWLQCPRCKEIISPGRVELPYSPYIAGMTHYYLDDEEITKERYEQLREQLQQ